VPLCLYRTEANGPRQLGLIDGDRVIDIEATGGPGTLAGALAMPLADLKAACEAAAGGESVALASVSLAAPVDYQEVWAAGVTYLRSRDARMEESTQQDVYAQVYDAERPEVFLKATPDRVSNPGEPVAIRADSTWDVPEPEVALLINADGEIAGYTIGNDVSSRSIEGENPIYLPQAKIYRACAGLGPVVALPWEIDDPRALSIRLEIHRDGELFFAGESSTGQMRREFGELVSWLRRCQAELFGYGVILMTGTGIIPPSEFTLQAGDEVRITVDGIGTLVNPVIELPV
jgi:2-dehydro-3-deoxy-D-arabinonate dehydratase